MVTPPRTASRGLHESLIACSDPHADRLEAAQRAWADATPPSAKLEAGFALAQLGDYSGDISSLDCEHRLLPWRAGVKYFSGHDVDGGSGLHR
ncbi:hypothetical protein GCM10027427_21380 [Pseudoclavibacter terrae]